MSWPRFGTVAIKLGFASFAQVKEALIEQLNNDVEARQHKTIGEIFIEKGWMKHREVRKVMDVILSDKNELVKEITRIYKENKNSYERPDYFIELEEELKEHGYENIEMDIVKLPERRLRYWHGLFTHYS